MWIQVPYTNQYSDTIHHTNAIATADGRVLEYCIDTMEDRDSGEMEEVMERIVAALSGKIELNPELVKHYQVKTNASPKSAP